MITNLRTRTLYHFSTFQYFHYSGPDYMYISVHSTIDVEQSASALNHYGGPMEYSEMMSEISHYLNLGLTNQYLQQFHEYCE